MELCSTELGLVRRARSRSVTPLLQCYNPIVTFVTSASDSGVRVTMSSDIRCDDIAPHNSGGNSWPGPAQDTGVTTSDH